MTESWFMLTLVGKDRPGIVARVGRALYEGGCNLGEASMMRLGDSFTIMMMVHYAGSTATLADLVGPVAEGLGLAIHVDRIAGGLHHHVPAEVCITVYGADRAGIVAQVTGTLAEAGLNITDLTSSVAGTETQPLYVMEIEGQALQGIEALQQALAKVTGSGIEARLSPLDTLIG
jgi:glycine cleavage system transcriptional repressor